MGTRKYRFLPTNKQKQILIKWCHTARYTYNQTVHKISKERQPKNWMTIRNRLVPKKKVPLGKEWILETPKDIRASSVKEVITSYKSNFTNLKNGNINHFKIGFRSRKKQTQETISIPKTAVKLLDNGSKLKIYNRYTHSAFNLHHEKIEKINNEIKIIYVKRCNLWYLCVPIEYDICSLTENQGNGFNVVSIDPGIKTFLTLYDCNGQIFKIGNDDIKYKLVPLYTKIDRLKSFRSRCPTILTRRNIKKRITKLIYKFKNLLLEIHNKASYFLTTNYSTILIPHLVNKYTIKSIYGKTNRRNLLSWNHSNFLERLQHQAIKRGKVVKIVTEEYTSKTCGNCGCLHSDLSNKDIYECVHCGLVIDRDTNGSRNILLKNLK